MPRCRSPLPAAGGPRVSVLAPHPPCPWCPHPGALLEPWGSPPPNHGEGAGECAPDPRSPPPCRVRPAPPCLSFPTRRGWGRALHDGSGGGTESSLRQQGAPSSPELPPRAAAPGPTGDFGPPRVDLVPPRVPALSLPCVPTPWASACRRRCPRCAELPGNLVSLQSWSQTASSSPPPPCSTLGSLPGQGFGEGAAGVGTWSPQGSGELGTRGRLSPPCLDKDRALSLLSPGLGAPSSCTVQGASLEVFCLFLPPPALSFPARAPLSLSPRPVVPLPCAPIPVLLMGPPGS